MITCIEESTTISQSLLDTILRNLISPYKEENPAAYRLAQNLISRTATKLQPYITQFLVDKMSDSELRKKEHELIFELNKISSQLLLKILPMLQADLTVSCTAL